VSISAPFIRRPIATTLLTCGILLLGLLGYRLLPVSALPQVDFPTIQVTTELPGAGPDVIAATVTTPLERHFGQIASLESMTSTSAFGVSTITLQFALERDIDAAAQDVQAAINAASGILPRNLPSPPTYSKVNPADTPILVLAVTSDVLPLDKVNDLADTMLAQKLSQVAGVGLVTIEGNQKPAVRIQVNPAALASLDLGLEDVRAAIAQANVSGPKGSFDGPRQAYTIAANDQIRSAEEYARIIVAYRNGAPVRLADIGQIVESVENTRLAAWHGDRPAVLVDVQRQPGANIIETVDRIKELLPRLSATLPPGVEVSIVADRTETIRASVEDVQFTLVLTVALVVLVIFLFLRKLWATVIPSIALPVSLIGTFGAMALCGFSLDNLSLMALTIAAGFVVDDAIVMIENIVRHVEAGKRPLEAALDGARQIGFTIVSLTVSLIAVFIPLLFMGGVVGRLFREFALTLSIAVAISAVVSLTLTPMMCGRLLKAESEERHGRLFAWSEAAWQRLLRAYERSLSWVLRRQKETLAVALGTLALTIALYWAVPKGFLPQQDTGLIVGVTDAAQDISFKAMARRQQAVAAAVMADPDVASVASFVGAGTVNATVNTGRLYISLVPHRERTASIEEVMARLREAVAPIEGITLSMQAAQDIQIDTRASRTQYQYTLVDADLAELAEWAPRLLGALKARPELADVASDQQTGGFRIDVVIDRDKAARLGVLPQAVDDTLYDAFGQRQVSTIYTQMNQYRVILEVTPEFQIGPESLEKIYVKSAQGQVPLGAIATIVPTTAPLAITHHGQFPSVTLSFNVAPGSSLGAAIEAIEATKAEIGLPESIATVFTGSAAEFRVALANQPILILAAILVIYIVLGILYESTIHPVTILSTLPSAGVGALLALVLAGYELSLVALVGIILLIGIVKKNAIMMIDFALEAEREEGMPPERSIYEAALLRFRPIMMTTMAALFGALPLALGQGPGSELRRPMGVAIVGGLLLSQLLTLYTTPVIYLYMDRLGAWLRGRGNAPERPLPRLVEPDALDRSAAE
jgi:hydrophobe/amphiphile efflux-1 (HAE1) family protein